MSPSHNSTTQVGSLFSLASLILSFHAVANAFRASMYEEPVQWVTASAFSGETTLNTGSEEEEEEEAAGAGAEASEAEAKEAEAKEAEAEEGGSTSIAALMLLRVT